MSDWLAALGALGKGVSTTARATVDIKELERRAQEDAKRLQLSMQSLELSKNRFAFEQETAAADEAYRQQQAKAARLRAALDAEAGMVEAARKQEDRLHLERVLHGYAKEIEGMRQTGRVELAESKGGASKPYGLDTSTINTIVGHAKSEAKYGADFGGALNQALNSMVKSGLTPEKGLIPGAKKIPGSGETKPFRVSELRPVAKKSAKVTKPKIESAWDPTKLTDEELRELAK